MSVILSPAIEQALIDLRQAIIKQLEEEQVRQADSLAAPGNNAFSTPAESTAEVSPAVVLPSAINQTNTVYQSPINTNNLGDDPATSLPYPEMPAVSYSPSQISQSLPANQESADIPVPQMPMPDLSAANTPVSSLANQSPVVSPPIFNPTPAETNVNDNQQVEFVPNPDQVIMPTPSELPEITPNPQPASFTKARGLLSSVLQKHHS